MDLSVGIQALLWMLTLECGGILPKASWKIM